VHALDGAKLSILWGIPFLGILLSIALFPLVARHFWHRHYGKVALFWIAALLLPLAFAEGFETTARAVLAAALHEYLPFIILLFALFTVAGGILVSGELRGNAATNTEILGVGTLAASVIGTTGASMILIRPLLRANEGRRHPVHVVIFFIRLQHRRGIDAARRPAALRRLPARRRLLLDREEPLATDRDRGRHPARGLHRARPLARGKETGTPTRRREANPHPRQSLAGIIAAILMSALWKPGAIAVYGVAIEVQNLARDAALLVLAFLSLRLTADEHRVGPTYLVFFELAGGDPRTLMGPFAGTLAAISMGAVYMGALTYIGNAPNFMVYAIAEERGIRMPNFFGYLAWAALALVPNRTTDRAADHRRRV
jgi:Na+/H+ antiporter NhaD/arsenite permease-like protein